MCYFKFNFALALHVEHVEGALKLHLQDRLGVRIFRHFYIHCQIRLIIKNLNIISSFDHKNNWLVNSCRDDVREGVTCIISLALSMLARSLRNCLYRYLVYRC